MEITIIPQATLWWAAGLVIGFPIAVLVLGETILRLKRAQLPVASTLAIVRNLVLPAVAILILEVEVIGLPMQHTTVQIGQTLVWIFLIHAALSFVNDVVFVTAAEGSWQSRVPKLLLDLVRLILVLVGTAIVLSTVWGLDLKSFVAALGVGSLVLGLALQEPLGNVFAGVVLLFEQPFIVGDWIRIGATTGRVVEINWRAVHLETDTQQLLVVPSGSLSKGEFANLSRPTRIHSERIKLGLSYNDPPNKVKRVLRNALRNTPGVLLTPEPKVVTLEFADFSVNYCVTFYVESFETLSPTRDAFMTRIWYIAKREGLSIPYPTHVEYSMTQEEYVGGRPTRPSDLIRGFPQLGVHDQASADEIASSIVTRGFCSRRVCGVFRRSA